MRDKIEYLKNYDGRPLRLMEVCGTHTAGIFKSGLRSVLPDSIRLISGPGCPVCVTPTSYIDKCVEYALAPDFALVSFGDMMKVPGSDAADGAPISISRAKGLGARVELAYSPFDAIGMAEREPDTIFIVAAVGFETTAPAYALLMDEIIGRRIKNISLLTALKSAIPAIEWVCEKSPYPVDGFLCPGHVSVITGSRAYEPLAKEYGKPFVVGGFEEAHLVDAVYELVRLASREDGGGAVVNRYPEAVTEHGNAKAREATEKYFDLGAAVWRGLGPIATSGMYLKSLYIELDAGSRSLTRGAVPPAGCRCADVITGGIDPPECPAFGSSCTPENARGPCMVSAEGACGVWYQNSAQG
ncbi:MAG: hydrogenase formation protein HypD [Clostridiales Family XIII bacterium]|jgi:hydrogenase expression/formation protein HypD|nr:hydrogenase formation protein HypD [Clostridiales Family XIII bacterium]